MSWSYIVKKIIDDGATHSMRGVIPRVKPYNPSFLCIDLAASQAPEYCVLLCTLLFPCTWILVFITSCTQIGYAIRTLVRLAPDMGSN